MSTVNAGWRGPNIVKEGLVLYLDAASGTSYSPYNSGITWKDISGNNNNGTLTNGPVYNTANGGSFIFDGVDDYCTVTGLNLNEQSMTVSFTFKSNRTIQNDWTDFLSLMSGSLTFIVFEKGGNNGFPLTNGYLKVYPISYTSSLADVFTPGVYVDNLEIVHYTLTADSNKWTIYQNDNVNATGSISGSNSIFTRLVIGTDTTRSSRYAACSFSNIRVYNRALSTQEILQNYNSTKGRFGL